MSSATSKTPLKSAKQPNIISKLTETVDQQKSPIKSPKKLPPLSSIPQPSPNPKNLSSSPKTKAPAEKSTIHHVISNKSILPTVSPTRQLAPISSSLKTSAKSTPSKNPAILINNETDIPTSVDQQSFCAPTSPPLPVSSTEFNPKLGETCLEALPPPIEPLIKKEEPQNDDIKLNEEAQMLNLKYNGVVVVKYNIYEKKFPIVNGSLDSSVIDAEWSLRRVMPNCKLHLAPIDDMEAFTYLQEDKAIPYVLEEPDGIYQGLEAETELYLYVEEDTEENLKRWNKIKSTWGASTSNFQNKQVIIDAGSGLEKYKEKCSCKYGAPCVDQFTCDNWSMRYATAKENGWRTN